MTLFGFIFLGIVFFNNFCIANCQAIFLIKDAIFVGNDLECGKANLLNCLLACQIKTMCTHFTWNMSDELCCHKNVAPLERIPESRVAMEKFYSGFFADKMHQKWRVDDLSEYDAPYIVFWIQTTFNGYEISPVINNISFSNCLELCYNGEMCTHLTYKNEKCSMKNAPTLETIRKSSVFNGPSVSVSLPWKFKSLGKDP